MKVEIIFGLIMILITLLYITFGVKENSSKVMRVGQNGDATSGVLEEKKEKFASLEIEDNKQDK